MSKYKLLLLDVDGTTVASNEGALPSERVVRAIKAANRKLSVALVTGRSVKFAKPVINELGLKGLGVFNGGAEIIDMETSEKIHCQFLSTDCLTRLADMIDPFGYRVYVDDDYYDSIKSVLVRTSDAIRVAIRAVKDDEISIILDKLKSIEDVSAHHCSSWDGEGILDIHVNHRYANKRYGVERLTSMLGVTKDEVIAIGDGHNDMPLFEAAGFSVAMGNAHDCVKFAANHVAPSLANDGVADTIERFVI